ncbi:uncharacterized protein DNG_09710 [Cephalotrichum gorgonifer]|uniref:Uncharacterized protein n=1 Tax=Cephalotrichum gorgonifer TaxID=2041049 RepID=A0AAE8N672_9PEZI|nr:uncharacterized protein DNG_09710 [Cephalotrichum gorgonifer]
MLAKFSLALTFVVGASAVNLQACNKEIQDRLANQSLASDASIFHFNGTQYMSDPENLQLTINGCRSECANPDFDLYDDMWPRLLTWLFPVLLMIGNLHLPRVGHFNRFLVIFHYLGDPIDSMWSLLTKAEVWNRFYHIALRHTGLKPEEDMMARSYAALMSAFDELTDNMPTAQGDLDAIMRESAAQLSMEDSDYILRETADELADSRTNEVLRTTIIILNYLWTVVASLDPQIGGEQSSKPGGRIGTAMFLSWIVSAVLLSNTLSGFTSRRTCLRVVERYLRTMKGRKRDLHYFPNSPHLVSQSKWIMAKNQTSSLSNYFDAQPWNGSVYSYRKNKRLIPSGHKADKSTLYLLLVAYFPILIAVVCAFVILYETPNVGLGCRTLWVMTLGAALLISPGLTYLLNKVRSKKLAWYLVAVKDVFIAVPIMTVVILSSIGIFNTCWCWSAVYSLGINDAFVILDVLDEREKNGKVVYPALVGLCLGLQVVTFVAMHHIMKPGGRVFRLAEDEKEKAYKDVHDDGTRDTELRSAPYESPMDGQRSGSVSYGSPLYGPRSGSVSSVSYGSPLHDPGSGSPLLPRPGATSGMQDLELPPAAIGGQDERHSFQGRGFISPASPPVSRFGRAPGAYAPLPAEENSQRPFQGR